MKFTETEIERFGKAKELQADWKPQVGDWFYKADGLGHGTWLICRILGGTLWCAGEEMKKPYFDNRLVEFRAPENYIWIPSLERLQGMVNKMDYADAYHSDPSTLWELTFGEVASDADTLKLLLLSFVMRGRYQRRWDGKTWRNLSKPKAKK